MAEFPSMPLWTDAYLADTSHLTTIEHGAYLLLLMVMWRTTDKRLPDDDKKLARYARMTPGQWKRIAPTLREFFKAENGYLYQPRLTDEANAVRRYRERQSQAGKASALKRKERHSTTVKSGCNREASPTPTPNSVSKDTGASADPEKEFWRKAVAYLGESKRSMIGRWRSKHGWERVAAAVTEAQATDAVEPVAFIERILRGHAKSDDNAFGRTSDGWEIPI